MIEINGLSFSYKKNRVFKNFSASFGQERSVLIGPNGAGKSTIFKLLVGMLKPQSGSIQVNDTKDVGSRTAGKFIGYMPQSVPVVRGLTVHEQVSYYGWIKGLTLKKAEEEARILLTQVDIEEFADRKVKTISGGQHRRVGIASAIIGNPPVLVIDEPTAGIDPAQRAKFRRIILEIPKTTAVLVSTHLIDDLALVYDRIFVLNQGEIIWDGMPKELVGNTNTTNVRDYENAYISIIGDAV